MITSFLLKTRIIKLLATAVQNSAENLWINSVASWKIVKAYCLICQHKSSGNEFWKGVSKKTCEIDVSAELCFQVCGHSVVFEIKIVVIVKMSKSVFVEIIASTDDKSTIT